MRRYGRQTQGATVPGPDARLKLTLQPLAETPPAPCVPDPRALYWFSDLTGDFSEVSEAAYVLDVGAAGPVLGVAKIVGETCGEVTWSRTWTPAEDEGGGPAVKEDGPQLIVYPTPATQPGILEVTAKSAGRTLGPIVLAILRYSCYYGYGSGGGCLAWRDFADAFEASATSGGIAWGANFLRWDRSGGDAFFMVDLAARAGLAFPSPCEARASFVFDQPQPYGWSLALSLRDGQTGVEALATLNAGDSLRVPLALASGTPTVLRGDLTGAGDFVSGLLILEIRAFG